MMTDPVARSHRAVLPFFAAVVLASAVTGTIAPSDAARPAELSKPLEPASQPTSFPTTAPTPPSRSGHGRRIVFDQSEQRVWLVGTDETVRRSYLVTGSNRGNLQPDTYQVTSRARHARSFRGSGTFEFFVRFAQGRNAPIGFHSVTASQGQLVYTRADLGRPRTPGCVEQWHDDAQALWAFAPVGTPVVVTP